MSSFEEVLGTNKHYVDSFGDKESLPLPPARKVAVLTCMDATLDPTKFLGLTKGDDHVVRIARGRASDNAIRSLVISYKFLGTKEFYVIHHSNCGMEFFTDETMTKLLAPSLETAELTPDGFRDIGSSPRSGEGDFINWMMVKDNAKGVVEDVKRIRKHSFVLKNIPIFGFIYNVTTTVLQAILEAIAAGATS